MHFRRGKQFLKSAECFTLRRFIAEGFWKRLDCLGSANSAPFNDLVVYIVFDVMTRVPFLDSQKDTTTHWELCVV